jgi:hypothetical protein
VALYTLLCLMINNSDIIYNCMSFKDLYRGKCFLQKKYGLTNTNFEKLFRVFLTITMACVYDKLRKQFFWFQITMSATISTYTLFSVRLYSHLYLSGFMFYFCYCIQYYLWTTYGMSAHQHWFFPGTPASSTNEADRHDIDEILLKVELNTITLISLYEL